LNKELLIIAGEASGDLHGASLIRELKSIDPSVKFIGIGGNKMRSQGMELLFHINQMAFLGFAEVIRHIPFIKKVQNLIIREVISRKIDTVVLIDYPGFNLNIAKKLKNLDVKVIYYISPQIWAWGHGRIKKIKKLVDKMIVILPFEEEFFRNAGVNVEYVGHPLLEQIENYDYLNRDDFFRKFSLDVEREILLLLPGSRLQEVKRIFPESIKAASRLSEDLKMQLVVACSSDIDEKMFF
jgi:lipid-A-disaccharide synthase